MLPLLFILVFVFCFAIAIASTFIAQQFVSTYNTGFHKNYFYYLVAFYGFALYGIWAQVLMRFLLSSLGTSTQIVEMAANFLPILGMPFLFISWIMLIKMGYSLAELPSKKKIVTIQLILFGILIPLSWGMYLVLSKDHWLFDQYLVYTAIGLMLLIELVYMLIFMVVVSHYLKGHSKTRKKIIIRFLALMLLGLVLRIIVLPFHNVNPWILTPLLLLYFLSNFMPLFYLRFHSDSVFTPVFAEYPNEGKKILLFEKYRISRREKDIVNKICQGKTNQQIADELFISLQTVKDHTHRIYSKIGINSRLKLVQMING